jgi:hypothetical protein
MGDVTRFPSEREEPPASLGERAAENLRYVRETLERSASFTAVPGIGGVLMGALALVAAWIASQQGTPERWLLVWLACAALAFPVGAVAMVLKARATGHSLLRGPGRRFALSFLPPVGVGASLTAVLAGGGATGLLPGVWLLCYGAAVVTGGAFSVKVVPATGVLFMALGGAFFLAPASWGDAFMAAGFGALHILSGCVVARRYGG